MSFLKDFDHLKIQMKDVVSATNNFDPTKVIGCGGFGKVYKGELSSPEGQITVAFKQLDRRLGQGKIEFWKEIMMLSKYKHENLISLQHFCIEGDEMILVYEYASRGSLDRYLADATALTWVHRLKICVGAARGLRFLHDPKGTQQRILHRDIKSANILLDENWTAKVSDFGLSKVGPTNPGYSYLISHALGTPGYCDPLYMELGYLSKESDVYSFGVVLFEILCGRLCYEYCNRELTEILVPKWRQCYEEKRLDEIILPGLKEQMEPSSFISFSTIAYECVKKDREERPTMAVIVEELKFLLQKQLDFENTPESNHSDRADDDYSQSPDVIDGVDSYELEGGPGIDGFQIIGDAKPGGKLLACGFPVRGTSLCMFQWIRYFIDGTPENIEGATNPEYVVTADDVGHLIVAECIPMDDQGQQGKIVRLFANEQNKISCDPEMQQEIDKYMSAGEALFSVLLQMDPSKSPELTFFSLTRSKYKIIIKRTQEIFMDEKYSRDLSIKIPLGLSSQFLLARSDRSSKAFSFNDVRTRDTFVLTMRMFQSKVVFENTPESNHSDRADDDYSQSPDVIDGVNSYDLEGGPGLENFQIIGDAKPGGKLLACGYPVRGTSFCKFQWIRYFIDGTPENIEGATNPEYVVTADDVGHFIVVECIPMDDQGRQGKIVRLFANEQNKISCDPEMQQEIDKYMSAGEALFSVLLLDPSKSPEQTIFSLTRSKYKIIIKRTQEIFMDEKYSRDLSIKIPPGLTSQFLLARPDGSSQAFSFNDVRTRDTFVLTMRMFQSKALDQRRKTKT